MEKTLNEYMDHLSFSSINTLLKCSEKFNKRYIEKVRVEEESPDYFAVGKIVDDAFRYAQNNEILVFSQYVEENDISFQEEKWFWWCKGVWDNRRELFTKVFDDPEVLLQYPVTLPIINTDTGEILKNNTGAELKLTGFLDGHSKKLYKDYEVKTTGAISDNLLEQYAFNGQTQLYCKGIMSQENNRKVPETEYIFIQKPRIKQKKKETEEAFFQRIYECGVDPEIKKVSVHYNPDTLEETVIYYFDAVKANLNVEFCKNRNECIVFANKCVYFNKCWSSAFQIEEEQQTA